MKKHSFDPVSFIFGVLFLLAGIPLIVSDSGFELFRQRWVFPAFLVAAGLVVLLTSQLTDRSEVEEPDRFEEDPIR